MDTSNSALAVILCGLAALFAWNAAAAWLTLGKRNGADFPAATFKRAAIATFLALVMIGACLAWAALMLLP